MYWQYFFCKLLADGWQLSHSCEIKNKLFDIKVLRVVVKKQL